MLEVRPDPLPHQAPMLASAARYKLLPCGRRSGKTRAGLTAAVCGHGPDRCWRGMVQGAIISWIAPDIPQARDVWHKDMLPRFRRMPGAVVSLSDKTVTFPNGGYLEIRSMDNINSVRGGALDGVLFDEAAHMDLQDGWENVVRAKLMDRVGWVIFMSTTNAGLDGNQRHETPSYFNRLCDRYDAHELDGKWQMWNWSVYDNPRIPREEIEETKRGLGGDKSAVWQQEYLAKRITGGAGQAFPEWKDEVHVVANRNQFPMDWEWVATLDWGYRQGHYGLWGVDPEGTLELVWEYSQQFTSTDAYQAAVSIFQASQFLPSPRHLYYDDQMAQEHGIQGGMTLKSEFARGMNDAFGGERSHQPIMFPTVKGSGSRVIKKNAMHNYLAYDPARLVDPKQPVTLANILPWARPRLRAEARCQGFIMCMQKLPLDPAHPDDVAKSPIDHPYDSACMLLVTRPIAPAEPREFVSQDQFRKEDLGRTGRRKWETMLEDMQKAQSSGGMMGGYRVPRASEYRELG